MNARIISAAQVILSCLFVGGYFWVLSIFLLGHIKTPEQWEQPMTALLGALTAGLLLILQFWFSRSRSHEPTQ